MGPVQAICLDSLLAVIEAGDEYQTRRILRWYSREFHTPLHVAEELPLEDILRAFFECQFETLTPKKQLERAAELTETAEETATKEALARAAEAEDDDFMDALEIKGSGKKTLQSTPDKSLMVPPVITGTLPEEIEIVFGPEG